MWIYLTSGSSLRRQSVFKWSGDVTLGFLQKHRFSLNLQIWFNTSPFLFYLMTTSASSVKLPNHSDGFINFYFSRVNLRPHTRQSLFSITSGEICLVVTYGFIVSVCLSGPREGVWCGFPLYVFRVVCLTKYLLIYQFPNVLKEAKGRRDNSPWKPRNRP